MFFVIYSFSLFYIHIKNIAERGLGFDPNLNMCLYIFSACSDSCNPTEKRKSSFVRTMTYECRTKKNERRTKKYDTFGYGREYNYCQGERRKPNIIFRQEAGGKAMTRKLEIPFWKKAVMTVDEASAYSSIGINKLYDMPNDTRCSYVLRNGNRRLIKRKEFDEYISETMEI